MRVARLNEWLSRRDLPASSEEPLLVADPESPNIERRLPALMHDTIDLITRGGKKIPGDKLAQFSMEADQLSPERRRTDAPPEGTEV